MSAARVLVVSDSHLSATAREANGNWAAVAPLAERYELVIHVGDLSLDGAQDRADLAHARRALDALPIPWVTVPGNHDIGDNPGTAEGPEVDAQRCDRWVEHIGPDHWALRLGEWTVVGINAQIFGSGLGAETQQWEWLEERLAAQGPGQPVLLVTHKPLAAPDEEVTSAPRYRFVPEPSRSRLVALLDTVRCPLVLSGHVHQYRNLTEGGRSHVWIPTTWAVLPETLQESVGLKRCGVVSLDLRSDGTASEEFVEPPGLAQLTLTHDVPNPYT